MIPKVIHYCWFGGNELPKSAVKCINSWKKYCPDYEIIEWNERNFDINSSTYVKFCYENKKYAFLSDYVRLWAVYNYGGLYMDTDVELVRPLNDLLDHKSYFGFETKEQVNTGLGFGAEKGNKIVEDMIKQYSLNKTELIVCPELNTRSLINFGLIPNGEYQILDDAVVYPIECFNPYESTTGRLKKTKNTYSIHWYSQSWLSWDKRIRSSFTKPFHRLFGDDCFKILRKSNEKNN